MSTQASPRSEVDRPNGDVIQALSHLTASIAATDKVLDVLRKELDPIVLDLAEPSMASVATESQSRSPMAEDIHHQASRIIGQRLRLERLLDIIQL